MSRHCLKKYYYKVYVLSTKTKRKTTKDGFSHPHGRKFSIQLQTAPCISKSTIEETKDLKPFGTIIL
jgi:hypothetical protein